MEHFDTDTERKFWRRQSKLTKLGQIRLFSIISGQIKSIFLIGIEMAQKEVILSRVKEKRVV